ncbi:MAG TPA: sulfate ABC transporter ATP-binding protein [Candidatus Competibacteraceae bacterium]|nr:sulfate ABC transporter ATP-binding protein [Candidatus Competibacteraceae bacterium]HQA26887.1 sulfate ABC transporter ATP-binding protein [Candidatus Competibacteraceae bacterium]HQD55078.1 sulfate ABC transporter ATP-binding protein [Candidatus Competibacteraceae bacterium]
MSIRVQDIAKRFGSFVALDHVTLDFPTGQLIGLLGPSGCGKTTLLRIIAGLEFADSGQVFLNGEDASSAHVRERQVGFVFQHYALFRHMTVFDNVAFGLRVRPRKQRPSENAIRARVDELLELVQLSALAKRYPTQLSGGQRQRIALARALAVEPRVLLLDEPFGALDAKVRKELRRWLRQLHDALHITSIFVTHDQEEALEVSDRVVLMNQGRIEQVGTPQEVYEHPATPFVYSFLGSVNLFHGRVRDHHLQVGAGRLSLGQNSFQSGAEALGFVRPHELDIDTNPAATVGISARVERVLAFGSTARVELVSTEHEDGRYYEAELSRERAAALNLANGQRVRLKPTRIQLFPPESRAAGRPSQVAHLIGVDGEGI